MLSRRTFIKAAGGAGLGFVLVRLSARGGKVALAQVPGGTLDPASVPKYRAPLLIPPVMPRAARIPLPGGKPADYYEISMRQFSAADPARGPAGDDGVGLRRRHVAAEKGLLLHHAPSLDDRGEARPAGAGQVDQRPGGRRTATTCRTCCPVDPTLHWANPPGGVAGRDTRPDVHRRRPGAYTGPVPMVTHLHGAVGVGDESDGYAEAWYPARRQQHPGGYATEGTWYDFFAGQGAGQLTAPRGGRASRSSSTRTTTARRRSGTTTTPSGMTRLNVYAGPAGFYLVRGGPEGDKAVLDSRTGSAAVLPGPAPKEGDAFPSNKTYYEIPIAIQDRSFNTDGSLFYPDTREFFDGIVGATTSRTATSRRSGTRSSSAT